jgi:hypothetical protein
VLIGLHQAVLSSAHCYIATFVSVFFYLVYFLKRVHVFDRKTLGKKPVGRPGRRWKDNIKMDVQEVG